MRTNEVEEVQVEKFWFRNKSYEFIRIDLGHINFDKGNNRRSDFDLEDVTGVIIDELEGKDFDPVGEKDGAEFFVHLLNYNKKPYKLIFETRENSIFINVISLFRQKRRSK